MIGERVLRQACHDTSRWRRARPIAVSVNVSVHQLDDPRFADMVIDALAAAELPGDALILELTESILAPTAPEHPEFDHLNRLRGHGIHIAVDDFGTGYSSLAYIARLPVDMVKLDKSFIRERHEPDAAMPDWTFTGAILEAIASLGLQAIAEGVETVEQADALRAKGCPLAQGFLFARPAPATAIDDVLGVRANQH
jgi:EAL domain-containing protein (putative c-di-GMP-specific phosphodiesterase class I)